MKKSYILYNSIIPLIILIVSFSLRLSLISKGPYHVDCLNLAIKAEKSIDTLKLENLFGSGYPGTVILGSIFIFIGRLFSMTDPVIAVNFMSVVFSSLSVIVLYFLAKKKFNGMTAIFSACMFSITPIFLGISVYGKSHTPSIFFLLMGILFLTNYLHTDRKKYLFISASLLGLMGATRLQDMILMIPPISVLFFFDKKTRKKIFKNILSFWLIVAFITILFHLPYALRDDHSFFRSQFFSFWEMGVLKSFRGLLSPSLLLLLNYYNMSLTPLGLILSLAGLILLSGKNFKMSIFLFLWIIIPAAFYGNLLTITPRLFAFSLPPILLAQGYLFSTFMQYRSAFKIAALGAYLLITFILINTIYPPLLYRHKNAHLPDYAKWVTFKTEENAIIISGSDEGIFLKYYGKRKILGKPRGQAHINETDLLDFKKTLDELLEKNIPVYITENSIYVYDPLNQFSNLLTQNYKLKTIGGHYSEFWHKGASHQLLFYNTLFKITKI